MCMTLDVYFFLSWLFRPFVTDFDKSRRDVMSGQLLPPLSCFAKVTVSSVKLSFINLILLLFCFREFALLQSCKVVYASINFERLKIHFHFFCRYWYVIYLLTAIALTPGDNSTLQFTHKQYTEQHNETEYAKENIHNNKEYINVTIKIHNIHLGYFIFYYLYILLEVTRVLCWKYIPMFMIPIFVMALSAPIKQEHRDCNVFHRKDEQLKHYILLIGLLRN
jgi:hypothetical protein